MKEKLKIEVGLELDFPDFDELKARSIFGQEFLGENYYWQIWINREQQIQITVACRDQYYYSKRESFEYSEENYEKAKGLIKTWIEELLKG